MGSLEQQMRAYRGDIGQEKTAQALPFSYTVKRNKTGAYSGELLISRKEGSKTLTRSSVLLAFHIILDAWYSSDSNASEREFEVQMPPLYKGPKAIGQIFGISYLYSIFWKLGLIQVPAKVAEKMRP